MGTPAQVVPGYYVWDVPGKPVVVHLNLNVVDRLAAEIMRGYGAVPRPGAEVGGLLIGTMETGPGEAGVGETRSLVKVEDFAAVPCEYRRGPSYLFTEDDGAAFEQAFAQPGVIGYFRSHTRDGLSLAVEDFELLDHFFPGSAHLALVVKPFATKASTASFFVRENGAFPVAPALEFPFRRSELMGEEPPPRRPLKDRGLMESGPRRRERPPANGTTEPAPDFRSAANQYPSDEYPQQGEPQSAYPTNEYPPGDYTAGDFRNHQRFDPPEPSYAYTAPANTRSKGWYWLPLSFVFLLLGLFVGFQIALSVGSRITNTTARDFSLDLSVSKNGDNLNVRWNGQSAAVRASQRGTLEITDGATTKPVELDAAQLQNGALIYRASSSSVRFRLILYPNNRVSVSESVEWK